MILQGKTMITFMVLFLGCWTAAGQVDSLKQPGKPSGTRHPSSTFAGGTLDILQGGQMNASARLFRLYLGRPGQKGVPLSISTGVMAGALAGYPLQDEGVSSLVNPAAGLLNMRVLCLKNIAAKLAALILLPTIKRISFRSASTDCSGNITHRRILLKQSIPSACRAMPSKQSMRSFSVLFPCTRKATHCRSVHVRKH